MLGGGDASVAVDCDEGVLLKWGSVVDRNAVVAVVDSGDYEFLARGADCGGGVKVAVEGFERSFERG